MGLLPIPSPRFTQGASRVGIRRAAALYDKRLLPPSFTFAQGKPVHASCLLISIWKSKPNPSGQKQAAPPSGQKERGRCRTARAQHPLLRCSSPEHPLKTTHMQQGEGWTTSLARWRRRKNEGLQRDSLTPVCVSRFFWGSFWFTCSHFALPGPQHNPPKQRMKSPPPPRGATGMDIRGWNCEKPSVLHDTGSRVVPWLEAMCSTQQCTHNTTVSNQRT